MRTASTLGIQDHDDQEALYRALNTQGYYWDSKREVWERNHEPPDPPTELLRIRVWAETSKVKAAANEVIATMEYTRMYEFLEMSELYACRPPKQLESRIYLTFKIHTPVDRPITTGIEPGNYDAVLGGKKR